MTVPPPAPGRSTPPDKGAVRDQEERLERLEQLRLLTAFAVPGPLFASLPPSLQASKERFERLSPDEQQAEIYLLQLQRAGVTESGSGYAWTPYAEREQAMFLARLNVLRVSL